MKLIIRENKFSSEHFSWSATISTRISDGVTSYIFIYLNIHSPTDRNEQQVLLHTPVVPVGQSSKFFSRWHGTYTILNCFKDVNYQIKELSAGKEFVVHYDLLKTFRKEPPKTNVPTREKTPDTAAPTSNAPTRTRMLILQHRFRSYLLHWLAIFTNTSTLSAFQSNAFLR